MSVLVILVPPTAHEAAARSAGALRGLAADTATRAAVDMAATTAATTAVNAADLTAPNTASNAAGDASSPVAARMDGGWKWVLSADGVQVTDQGEGPPALWPRAEVLVMALAPSSMSWSRIDLPKVPASRMKAALNGALEEALLEDAEHLHWALPPDAKPGRSAAVAVMQRDTLMRAVEAAEGAGRHIDRVVPAFCPTAAPHGHFQQAETDGPAAAQLVWCDTGSVVSLPLQGGGAKALVSQAPTDNVRWTSTPAAAAAAEAWAGRPVPVVTEAQLWLEAAGRPWELRQFDVAPRHRGLRWGRDTWRGLMGPKWRPVRLGLAALVVVQVVGLQAWAWTQQQAVRDRRQAQVLLLKATHPQVRVVLDAPLQMARETERLREAAGQPGEADLEAALAAASMAWPGGLGPAQALRYERGELSLSVSAVTPAQVNAMQDRLRTLGWSLEANGNRLSLTRR